MNDTPSQNPADIVRRLQEFLEADASGLYQRFYDDALQRWKSAGAQVDLETSYDKDLTARVLADHLDGKIPAKPKVQPAARMTTSEPAQRTSPQKAPAAALQKPLAASTSPTTSRLQPAARTVAAAGSNPANIANAVRPSSALPSAKLATVPTLSSAASVNPSPAQTAARAIGAPRPHASGDDATATTPRVVVNSGMGSSPMASAQNTGEPPVPRNTDAEAEGEAEIADALFQPDPVVEPEPVPVVSRPPPARQGMLLATDADPLMPEMGRGIVAEPIALIAPTGNAFDVAAPGEMSHADEAAPDSAEAPAAFGGSVYDPIAPAFSVAEPAVPEDQRVVSRCLDDGLKTVARWIETAFAESDPLSLADGDWIAARSGLLQDVAAMCDRLDKLPSSASRDAGMSPTQPIQTAVEISQVFYDGVYNRWRACMPGGAFSLREIGDAANELKNYLEKIREIGPCLYVVRGGVPYDSYWHELNPSHAPVPAQVLPLSFGVTAAPPNDQKWKVIVRAYDGNLVQREAIA